MDEGGPKIAAAASEKTDRFGYPLTPPFVPSGAKAPIDIPGGGSTLSKGGGRER